MALSIKWDCTYKCNLFCSYCINGDLLGNFDNEIDANRLDVILRDIESHYEVSSMHLLGGEPTTRKDFFEILQVLEMHKISFGFNTNAIKLNDNFISNLMNFNFLHDVTISLDGPNSQVNDSIRGRNVFNKIIAAVKILNKAKAKNNKNILLVINTVLSKDNSHLINEIIDLSLELKANQLNFLQLIESGNAKGNGKSLSQEEIFTAINVIADRYPDLKDKLSIVPKFVMPLAYDYSKIVLNKDFPKVRHGCGAGINFAFLDNRGRLFACDRLYVGEIDKCSFEISPENHFDAVWDRQENGLPFAIMESDAYMNLEPCKDCGYFKSECFPCPLSCKGVHRVIECERYLNGINAKKYNNIYWNAICRIANPESNVYIIVNTKNLATIKLNSMSYKIFNILKKSKTSSNNEILHISRELNVCVNEIYKLIDYLEEKGFIKTGQEVFMRCDDELLAEAA